MGDSECEPLRLNEEATHIFEECRMVLPGIQALFGFQLVAVFDSDPGKVGRRLGPFTIQSLSDMPASVQKHNIKLVILAVPADNAQDVADQLVGAGVRGLLNFAPVSITVPQDVALSTVDVAVHLEQLSFQVNVSPDS